MTKDQAEEGVAILKRIAETNIPYAADLAQARELLREIEDTPPAGYCGFRCGETRPCGKEYCGWMNE